MNALKSRGLMLFSNRFKPSLILAWLLLLPGINSCSHQTTEVAAPTLTRVKIKGIFDGADNYQRWVVFLTSKSYQSPQYQVGQNGRFLMEMVKIPAGNYRFNFGVKTSKAQGYSSFTVPVFKSEISLGMIPIEK